MAIIKETFIALPLLYHRGSSGYEKRNRSGNQYIKAEIKGVAAAVLYNGRRSSSCISHGEIGIGNAQQAPTSKLGLHVPVIK